MPEPSALREAHDTCLATLRRHIRDAQNGAGILLPGATRRALEAAEREAITALQISAERERAFDDLLEDSRESLCDLCANPVAINNPIREETRGG